jgi:hypothetical protein
MIPIFFQHTPRLIRRYTRGQALQFLSQPARPPARPKIRFPDVGPEPLSLGYRHAREGR